MLKKIFYTVIAVTCLLALLLAPVDRTPLKEKPFYTAMMSELDTIQPQAYQASDTLRVGWSRFSITPDHSMPMAGYSPRNGFEAVHDTLYTRILALNNGSKQVFMISMDLLLVPPIIKTKVEEGLKKQGKNDFLYFGAIHTHNGVGGWESHLGGRYIVGSYDEAWTNEVAENILWHIEKARTSMTTSNVSYFDAPAAEHVVNRLTWDESAKDGKIRGIKFERLDGKKAVLFTYSAHATSIYSSVRSLSGDYPGETMNELTRQGWDFPMFMAGMVGSHSLANMEGVNFELTKNAGVILAQKIQQANSVPIPNGTIAVDHINIESGSSQLRVLKNWRIRDWVFKILFGQLKAEVTYLKLGNVLFLGTSCDFSGELAVNNKFDSLANAAGQRVIISSFNGYYTGYITDDKHYDVLSHREEIRSLNWVGPYYGKYYSEIITKLLSR